jgi:hypothetical protein
MSTFMTSSNTTEVKEELAELLESHELADAILNKFEVLSKAREAKSWADYVQWVEEKSS